jgi:antitoxin component of RelBE/YafQ-DinJ toxin-antitoxin module
MLNKTGVIRVLVTPEQKHKFKLLCNKYGLNQSQYLRALVIKAINKQKLEIL